jgi:hypothetical protein
MPLKLTSNSIRLTYRRNINPISNITIDEGLGRLRIRNLCASIPLSCSTSERISIKVRNLKSHQKP